MRQETSVEQFRKSSAQPEVGLECHAGWYPGLRALVHGASVLLTASYPLEIKIQPKSISFPRPECMMHYEHR